MRSGETFDFSAKADREGSFEIEFSENAIVVYSWTGSTVKLFCRGEELGAGNFERTVVPPVPAGQSVSSFLGFMFGSSEDAEHKR